MHDGLFKLKIGKLGLLIDFHNVYQHLCHNINDLNNNHRLCCHNSNDHRHYCHNSSDHNSNDHRCRSCL
uniref:Uncharacterized protein n=1 Tax=Ciona intestinalis TaxID=7719 RepID=H2XTP3_CIOIN